MKIPFLIGIIQSHTLGHLRGSDSSLKTTSCPNCGGFFILISLDRLDPFFHFNPILNILKSCLIQPVGISDHCRWFLFRIHSLNLFPRTWQTQTSHHTAMIKGQFRLSNLCQSFTQFATVGLPWTLRDLERRVEDLQYTGDWGFSDSLKSKQSALVNLLFQIKLLRFSLQFDILCNKVWFCHGWW